MKSLLSDIRERPLPWVVGLLLGASIGSWDREREMLQRLDVIEATCVRSDK